MDQYLIRLGSQIKYNYVLSIEHEDPFFGEEDGLISGNKYLEKKNII
ncbi:hypothetical protein KEJ43_06120 [Candidatus Bathyarchaeota archaeon]|nr:hypothetical protein [Candidatus Bathyarchaeota archaeon]